MQKISNWMVDERGILQIADTKSFIFTDSEGNYSDPLPSTDALPGNELTDFLSTRLYAPPEEQKEVRDIISESYHAYTVGISLYEYISGISAYTPVRGTPIPECIGDHLNYNLPIFDGIEGSLIKTLIQNLVRANPLDRTPLNEVSIQLADISAELAFKKLEKLTLGFGDIVIEEFINTTKEQLREAENPKQRREILVNLNQYIKELEGSQIVLINKIATSSYEKLEKLGLGSRDSGMQQFIDLTKRLLMLSYTHEQRVQILTDVNQKIKDLEGNKVLSELKIIINHYKETASWRTIGQHRKAERIENALVQVPIDERINLLKMPQSRQVQALMSELSSQRIPIQGTYLVNEEGHIDEDRAARKYKEFRAKFKHEISREKDVTGDVPSDEPPDEPDVTRRLL